MREFNDGIKRIIEKFSYSFLIVQQNEKVICTCVDFTTKQADPHCPKCLGTGHKIKIKKIRGASEDSKGSFRLSGNSDTAVMTVFYIDAKYPVYDKNVIVDGDEVYMVNRLERKKTTNKELVYYKVYCNPKKTNTKSFLKNFNRIVNGGS